MSGTLTPPPGVDQLLDTMVEAHGARDKGTNAMVDRANLIGLGLGLVLVVSYTATLDHSVE